jgi:hypothetical protein
LGFFFGKFFKRIALKPLFPGEAGRGVAKLALPG